MNTYVAESSYSIKVVDCCGKSEERELTLNPYLPGWPEVRLRISGDAIHAEIVAADGEMIAREFTSAECTGIRYSQTLLHHEFTFYPDNGEPLRLDFSALRAEEVMEALGPFLAGWSGDGGFPGMSGGEAFKAKRGAPAGYRLGLFGRKRVEADPLDADCEFQMSGDALYLAEVGRKGQPGIMRYHRRMTVINRAALKSLITNALSVNSIEASIAVPGRGLVAFEMSESAAAALQGWYEGSVEAARQGVVKSMRNAAEELLRLTGVSLPEGEAQEALREIHNFKWLEAERVGFDTWAMIQPTSPLRAAAVHWVRKHYQNFASARPAHSCLAKSS